MIRARGYVDAGALALLLAVMVAVAAPLPVAAEEPLRELVRFPPGTTADFSDPMDPSGLFVEIGGASPSDLVEGWGAGRFSGEGSVVLVGTRFTSDEAAASAALGVIEGLRRNGGRLHGLGSLGEGWIRTIDLRETGGQATGVRDDSGEAGYLHEGFRVRGRDVLSFVYVTGQPTPPQRQLDHMAWHASTFGGGSNLPLPDAGRNVSYLIGKLTGGLVLALLVGAAIRGLVRRIRTTRGTPTPRSSIQQPGPPSSAAGDPQPPQARVIW